MHQLNQARFDSRVQQGFTVKLITKTAQENIEASIEVKRSLRVEMMLTKPEIKKMSQDSGGENYKKELVAQFSDTSGHDDGRKCY
jgi:hypothetical protein